MGNLGTFGQVSSFLGAEISILLQWKQISHVPPTVRQRLFWQLADHPLLPSPLCSPLEFYTLCVCVSPRDNFFPPNIKTLPVLFPCIIGSLSFILDTYSRKTFLCLFCRVKNSHSHPGPLSRGVLSTRLYLSPRPRHWWAASHLCKNLLNSLLIYSVELEHCSYLEDPEYSRVWNVVAKLLNFSFFS